MMSAQTRWLRFRELSCALVGRRDLSTTSGRRYLAMLRTDAPDAEALDVMLEEFSKAHPDRRGPLLQSWMTPPEVESSAAKRRAQLCHDIISLWYCAAIIDSTSPFGFIKEAAPPECYASGLIWRAIGGHPMGVPGPYFGSWSYRPLRTIHPPEEP